jgi:hypothetical protein
MCASSYNHVNATDTKELIGILKKRLTTIAEGVASKDTGEAMVEFATKTAVIKVIRCDNAVHQTNIELHKFTPNLNPEGINALSGMCSILKVGDTFKSKEGYDPDATGWISYEIVNYKGEISVQVVTKSTAYPDMTAYIGFEDGLTYYPKDALPA